MRKGSILSGIVREISIASYADDTPLSNKIELTLKSAIPGDVYEWFIGEVCPPTLSNSQGLKLLGWLFKDIKKAKLDLKHIKLIRQARREQFIDNLTENLPTPATMAHVTKDHLQAYNIDDNITENLVPYLSKAIKRDVETITVALQWSIKEGSISMDDCQWMLRYCRPVSEYEQLLLI